MLSELDYYTEIKFNHVNSVLFTCLAAPQVLFVHLARTFDTAMNINAFSQPITKETFRNSENNKLRQPKNTVLSGGEGSPSWETFLKSLFLAFLSFFFRTRSVFVDVGKFTLYLSLLLAGPLPVMLPENRENSSQWKNVQ